MIDDDEPILEKAIGYFYLLFASSVFLGIYFLDAYWIISAFCCRTEIEWLPGKCLTQKTLKKKPKKGSKNSKPITKTENCESFFNFFNPPQVPEDDEDIDEDTVSCYLSTSENYKKQKCECNPLCLKFYCYFIGQAEELQNQMEQDYDVG